MTLMEGKTLRASERNGSGWPVSGIPLRYQPSDKNSGFAVAHTPESQRDQKVSRPPGIVAHVPTSCRLEMSRAILRTNTTRDKSAGTVAEHECNAYQDLDSFFEILPYRR